MSMDVEAAEAGLYEMPGGLDNSDAIYEPIDTYMIPVAAITAPSPEYAEPTSMTSINIVDGSSTVYATAAGEDC